MTFKVFPYSLVRHAAMPFSQLHTLGLPGADDHMAKMWQLNEELSQVQQHICEQLFTAIQLEEDDNHRQQLLQLKRAVFNGRMPGNIIPLLTAALHQQLESYSQLLQNRDNLRLQWQHRFAEGLRRQRQQLQRWTQDAPLRKGILLSSPVLYEQLDSFAAADPTAFRAKETKIEYSLLRYVTRMGAKTSPFSTFTYTGLGELRKDQRLFLHPAAPPVSNIRLNNNLFFYLRSLFIHHPALCGLLEVKLNSSVKARDEHLHFLVNYLNVEAFQQLPARNLSLWLYQQLQEIPEGIRLHELVDMLTSQVQDSNKDEIQSFLLKLAATGLLELGIGCSGTDPDWDTALHNFLTATTAPTLEVTRLSHLLQMLRQMRVDYTFAGDRERFALLKAAAALLNTELHAIQFSAGLPQVPETATNVQSATGFEINRFSPRIFSMNEIFYEDTCTTEISLLPEEAVQSLTAAAEKLCAVLEPYDMLKEERELMRQFFLRHYQPTGIVDVMGFYRAYYLHYKKNREKKQELPVMEIPPDIQLDLSEAEVKITIGITSTFTAPVSRGMFVQYFEKEGEIYGVVNAVLPGMGKVAGRFLHLFGAAVAESFREWNVALHPKHVMIELNDGSSFNANMHPPLLHHEIAIPGGSNNCSRDQGIALKDISVRFNSKEQRLMLYSQDKDQEIFAYDLCLESFYNRSHFYRLLAHFNPEPRVPFRAFIAAVDRRYVAMYPNAAIRPRITFGKLVLRRQGWMIRRTGIPLPGTNETEADYFLRFHQWRKETGLPGQVFVILKPGTVAKNDGGKLLRDDYKPQYIDFVCPLLLSVFKKMISRAAEWIYLEEPLPAPAATGNVTEHMVHWYNY